MAQEKLKDLIPDILLSDGIDPDKLLDRTLSILSLVFDDLRLRIQKVPDIVSTDYSEYDRVPNGLMQTLFAKSKGVYLSNIKNINTGDNDTTVFEIWNRILNNLIYILKSKGTKQALKYILTLYGIDPNRLPITEYSNINSLETYNNEKYKRIPALSSGKITFNRDGFTTGSTSQKDMTVEFLIKRNSVGTALNFTWANYNFTLNVNNGALTGSLTSGTTSISNSITSTLTSISENNFYLFTLRKSANYLDLQRHYRQHENSDVVISDLVLSASITSELYAIEGRTDFNRSFTGALAEVRSWLAWIPNEYLQQRVLNPYNISFSGNISNVLVNRYRFNENRSVSSNMTDVNWFYNSASSSVTSTLTTNSLTANTLSSIYSYLVYRSVDQLTSFGIKPTSSRISLTSGNKSSNLIGIGYNVSTPINNYIYETNKNFNLVSLFGNSEEYYGDKLDSVEAFLNSVYLDWSDKIYNLSNYDEILDNTEYILASFYNFISQFSSIKSNIIEAGSTISNHILNSTIQKRKDIVGNTDITPLQTEFNPPSTITNNELINTLNTYTDIYNVPSKNTYYRDGDGDVISPIITETGDNAVINILATGPEIMIISNDTEDLPYNFIDSLIYITDDNDNTLIGTQLKITSEGVPAYNSWILIDPVTLDSYVLKANFVNTDETGTQVRIKYDALSSPFKKEDEKKYQFLITSNDNTIYKSIDVKLARDIKAYTLDTIKFNDVFLNDVFLKKLVEYQENLLISYTINQRIYYGLFLRQADSGTFNEEMNMKFANFFRLSYSDRININSSHSQQRYPVLNVVFDSDDDLQSTF